MRWQPWLFHPVRSVRSKLRLRERKRHAAIAKYAVRVAEHTARGEASRVARQVLQLHELNQPHQNTEVIPPEQVQRIIEGYDELIRKARIWNEIRALMERHDL